jgi:Flp pilus assembly protein TadG
MLGSLISRFCKDDEGAVLPLIGIVSIALIGATGFGIDTARLMLMHSSLQRSIDAGALSTVAKLDKPTIDAQLRKFTVANFADGQIGATLDSLTWSLSNDDKTLTVNATASAPTTFMSILGIDTMNTSAVSVIERSTTGLELALVLDNTGSMDGSPLYSLKSAANTLVDTLFGGDAVADKLYVGIVPFSQTVNVGKVHTNWLVPGALDDLDWGPTSWGGCVEGFSSSSVDMSDSPPSAKRLTPYYWQDDDVNDWITTRGNGKKTYDSYLNDQHGPNKYCPAEVTRLTSQKSKITSAIASMKAVGNTHINFGAVWGWRMLSPRWRGVWGGDMDTYNLPLDYGTPKMNKAAVIMTDGENTMSDGIYTAYGLLPVKILGTSDRRRAVDELNARLESVCTSMKNAGIIIYTIAFNGPDPDTQKLMRDCASQHAFYFDSPTNAALQSAFKQIGDSLSNLRISK